VIHVKFVRVAIKVRLQLAVDLLGPLSEPFLPQFVAKFVVRHFESVPLPHLSDGWTMAERVEPERAGSSRAFVRVTFRSTGPGDAPGPTRTPVV